MLKNYLFCKFGSEQQKRKPSGTGWRLSEKA